MTKGILILRDIIVNLYEVGVLLKASELFWWKKSHTFSWISTYSKLGNQLRLVKCHQWDTVSMSYNLKLPVQEIAILQQPCLKKNTSIQLMMICQLCLDFGLIFHCSLLLTHTLPWQFSFRLIIMSLTNYYESSIYVFRFGVSAGWFSKKTC